MLDYVHSYAAMGLTGLTDFILPFLVVLSILVFVHEWGHYIVARYYGVRVDVFSIGFGKELFGWTDNSGTRWKVSLIPLGGYVQMFGDTDPSSHNNKYEMTEENKQRPMTAEERRVAFFTKPVYQRAAIVFAGPAINFIFALIILCCLYLTVGKPVTPPVAAGIIVNSAADRGGLEPLDRIVAIDGDNIESFTDIQKRVAISLNTPLALQVLRNGQIVDLTITPDIDTMEDRFGFTQSRGMMGVLGSDSGINIDDIIAVNGENIQNLELEDKQERINALLGQDTIITLPKGNEEEQSVHVRLHSHVENGVDGEKSNAVFLTENKSQEIVQYGFTQAITASARESWFIITGTLEAIGQIFTGTRSATELGGIVRIGAIAGDAAQNGLISIITFTALLSINLGLINLFPVPLLDGGHLVFYAYEAIVGKPMSEKVMDYAFKCGMVLIIGLMAFANLNDIVQIIL